MHQAKKFLFDSNFDGSASNGGAAKAVPTFTEDDLAAARRQSLEEGKAAGRQEAASDAESLAAITIQEIGKAITALYASKSQASESNAREAAELAMAVTRKVIPEISKRGALKEIESMVSNCLAERFDEPRVVIRVHDSLLDNLRSRLDATAASAGFSGKFVLLAEEGLGVTDCRVEWADGGAERNEARLWGEIEEVARRFIEQLGPPCDAVPLDTPAPAEAPAITESETLELSGKCEPQKKAQDSESPGESHE